MELYGRYLEDGDGNRDGEALFFLDELKRQGAHDTEAGL